MNLLPKLEQLAKRYIALETELSQPDVVTNLERFTKLNKEYADLKPVVAAYHMYNNILKERADLEAMIADNTLDADMKAMVQADYQTVKEKIPALEEELKIQLLPKDANDDKNVILEIRAGTGGDEAALFAADMFRMYTRYAEMQGWSIEVMDVSENDIGGMREVTALISGAGAFARFKFESGTHRVQRVPATETQGRIHTSVVTVAVLPEAEEVEVHVEQKDLRVDVYRAQGAGGQHVNKTESAVRITHLPTGIVTQCQDGKSQIKNRASAMKMLLAKIYEHQQSALDAARASERKSQIGSGDRSERIRTYNFPQDRLTDHRIEFTVHNLENLMEGIGFDKVVSALMSADQARKLAELGEETAKKV